MGTNWLEGRAKKLERKGVRDHESAGPPPPASPGRQELPRAGFLCHWPQTHPR